MTEKKITRKVISKAPTKAPEKVEPSVSEEAQTVVKPKKSCYFCQNKTNPSYIDTVTLRRFITERAKIVPKMKSNLCSKHQRATTREIKYARHLSLLPFTPKV